VILPLSSRAGAGTPVTQVVYVQAIQDEPRTRIHGELLELGIQVRLAEVAAIDRIARVSLVLDFTGMHEPMPNPKLASEVDCIVEL
jgi:hypothetical protein